MSHRSTANPKQIGDYQLTQNITEDQLGTLFEGAHQHDAFPIWLKLFHSPFAQDIAQQQRFLEGMEYLKQFHHEKVLRIYDAGKDNSNQVYAVAEPFAGKNLQQLILEGNYFPSSRLMDIMGQLLDGLIALHDASLIHGDLRPSMIFHAEDKTETNTKILHLGHGWWWSDELREAGGFTQHSEFYLAPEQWEGKPWDHRVDIYACGLIITELLLGYPLHHKQKSDLFDHNHQLKLTPLLSELTQNNHDLPSIEKLLNKALAIEPQQRFSSALELREALEEMLVSSSKHALDNAIVEASQSTLSANTDINKLEAREKTTKRTPQTSEYPEDLIEDHGFADEATVIQSLSSIEGLDSLNSSEEDGDLHTVRVELDEALQNIDFQDYLQSHSPDTQQGSNSQQDLAAIEAQMLGLDDDLTRPGVIGHPNSLPPLQPMPTVRHEAPDLKQLAAGFDDPLDVTYVGPRDVARAAGESDEATPQRWLLWASIPVLAIALGIFLYFGIQPTTPLETPPPPDRKIFVTAEINTTPPGAEIWLNGEKTGQQTPATMRSRIGNKLFIQLKKMDHKPISFQWLAMKNSDRHFTMESTKPVVVASVARKDPPTPLPSPKTTPRKKRKRKRQTSPQSSNQHSAFPMATLTLKSIPPRAQVIVGDRKWPGQTPLRVRLRQGVEVKIIVRKYGHHNAFFYWKADGSISKTVRLYRLSWYNP